MLNGKTIFWIILAIVLVTVAFFVFENQEEPSKSKMTPFALGVVEKVSDSTIYFRLIDNDDKQEKSVNVQIETVLIKQVKDENGLIDLADVKVSDIKVGNQIVVYYSDISGTNYETYKIQVISDK